MPKIFPKAKLVLLFTIAVVSLIIGVIDAYDWYGKKIPSFFFLPNGQVGAFFQDQWQETQSLRYHDTVLSFEEDQKGWHGRFQRGNQEFALEAPFRYLEKSDFLLTAVLPLLCAIIYWVFALLLRRYHYGLPKRDTLFAFCIWVGVYLACLFDFHTEHHLAALYLVSFVVVGILFYHLAISFPVTISPPKFYRALFILTTFIGIFLGTLYLLRFFQGSPHWIFWEKLLIFYVSLGYLFWLLRLLILGRMPGSPLIRTYSRYLFWGNLVAFFFPFITGVGLMIANQRLPWQLATIFTLLFPISILVATLLAQLKDSRNQVITTEKLATLGSLTAGMAHELNNPLTLISANVDNLKSYLSFLKLNFEDPKLKFRGQLDRQQVLQEMMEISDEMELGIHRSQEIMDLLKKMTRAEEAPQEKFKARGLVQEMIQFLRPKYQDLKDRIKLSIPENTQLFLPRTLFLEILINLVTNALQASLKAEGEPDIHIIIQREGGWAHVGVEDQGEGINPEVLPRVKDWLFTTKDPGQGMGIGLALVDRWVRNWGGSLEIQSKIGKGTQVWLRLPQKGRM